MPKVNTEHHRILEICNNISFKKYFMKISSTYKNGLKSNMEGFLRFNASMFTKLFAFPFIGLLEHELIFV